MASIRKCVTKEGKVSFHVQVRRKGHKSFNFTCDNYKDAAITAKEIEDHLVRSRLRKKVKFYISPK